MKADLEAAREALATTEQRIPHREVLAEYGIAWAVSYKIEWSAPALRELRKLDKPLGRRILTAVTKLGIDLKNSDIPSLCLSAYLSAKTGKLTVTRSLHIFTTFNAYSSEASAPRTQARSLPTRSLWWSEPRGRASTAAAACDFPARARHPMINFAMWKTLPNRDRDLTGGRARLRAMNSTIPT
jgi:hypothetical protein